MSLLCISVINHLHILFFNCSSNEVWTLDLKTYKWQKQGTTPVQPPPRYGHSQVSI